MASSNTQQGGIKKTAQVKSNNIARYNDNEYCDLVEEPLFRFVAFYLTSNCRPLILK